MSDEPIPAVLKPARALGFSVSFIVGDPAQGDPNLVFQTHFDSEADEAEINEQIDRIMRITERQRARYEIKRIEKHMRNSEKMIAQAKMGDEQREANYTREREQIAKTIQKLAEQAGKVRDDDKKGWELSGRVGAHKMSAAGASQIKQLEKQHAALEARLEEMEREKAEAAENLARVTFSWEDEIRTDQAEIDRLSVIAA